MFLSYAYDFVFSLPRLVTFLGLSGRKFDEKVQTLKSTNSSKVKHLEEFKFGNRLGSRGKSRTELRFISLARQIEGALQKGYKPLEAEDVLVKSINPGMRLIKKLLRRSGAFDSSIIYTEIPLSGKK